jgi:hypothetical protein
VILEHFRAVCHSCEDEWQQYRAYSTLSRKEFATSIAGAKNTDYLFYKYSHPDASAEEFLKRQLTPALMRRMGVDNPNPIQFSREEELCV